MPIMELMKDLGAKNRRELIKVPPVALELNVPPVVL